QRKKLLSTATSAGHRQKRAKTASTGATKMYGANRGGRLRTRRRAVRSGGGAGLLGAGGAAGGRGGGATVVLPRDAMASAARGPGVHLLHGGDELVDVLVPGELGERLPVLPR